MKNTKERRENASIPIITTYGSGWNTLNDILKKHWHVLSLDPKIAEIVGNHPIVVARRAKYLKDMLVKSEYIPSTPKTWLNAKEPPKGMYQCGRCKACKHVIKGNSFLNIMGTKRFWVNSFINCNTEKVNYLVMCPCKKIYVGKTKRKLKTSQG